MSYTLSHQDNSSYVDKVAGSSYVDRVGRYPISWDDVYFGCPWAWDAHVDDLEAARLAGLPVPFSPFTKPTKGSKNRENEARRNFGSRRQYKQPVPRQPVARYVEMVRMSDAPQRLVSVEPIELQAEASWWRMRGECVLVCDTWVIDPYIQVPFCKVPPSQ